MSDPHCKIGKVRSKLRSRYRGAQAFDITVSRLVRLTASITDPVQREACKARGSVRPVSGVKHG